MNDEGGLTSLLMGAQDTNWPGRLHPGSAPVNDVDNPSAPGPIMVRPGSRRPQRSQEEEQT